MALEGGVLVFRPTVNASDPRRQAVAFLSAEHWVEGRDSAWLCAAEQTGQGTAEGAG